MTIEALEDLRQQPPHEEHPEGLEEDWLNVFGDYAARASSDRMRALRGRILAGEIRKPGAFYLSTMRILSELDKHVAELFQSYLNGIFAGHFLFNNYDMKGQQLIDLTMLEECGLLQDVNGSLDFLQKFSADGDFILTNENSVLIAKAPSNYEFRIPVISISRAGRELLEILPKENGDVVLRKIASLITNSAESVKLGLITSRPAPDQVTYHVYETIK